MEGIGSQHTLVSSETLRTVLEMATDESKMCSTSGLAKVIGTPGHAALALVKILKCQLPVKLTTSNADSSDF